MTTLFYLWAVAGVVLVALFIYARRRFAQLSPGRTEQTVPTLRNIVWEEVSSSLGAVRRIANTVRPHGERIVDVTVGILSKGKFFVVSRIYGRVRNKKGSTASFFLKQIAEDKGERKDDSERKN